MNSYFSARRNLERNYSKIVFWRVCEFSCLTNHRPWVFAMNILRDNRAIDFDIFFIILSFSFVSFLFKPSCFPDSHTIKLSRFIVLKVEICPIQVNTYPVSSLWINSRSWIRKSAESCCSLLSRSSIYSLAAFLNLFWIVRFMISHP